MIAVLNANYPGRVAVATITVATEIVSSNLFVMPVESFAAIGKASYKLAYSWLISLAVSVVVVAFVVLGKPSTMQVQSNMLLGATIVPFVCGLAYICIIFKTCPNTHDTKSCYAGSKDLLDDPGEPKNVR